VPGMVFIRRQSFFSMKKKKRNRFSTPSMRTEGHQKAAAATTTQGSGLLRAMVSAAAPDSGRGQHCRPASGDGTRRRVAQLQEIFRGGQGASGDGLDELADEGGTRPPDWLSACKRVCLLHLQAQNKPMRPGHRARRVGLSARTGLY